VTAVRRILTRLRKAQRIAALLRVLRTEIFRTAYSLVRASTNYTLMTVSPVSIAGDSPEDQQLWNTYVFWARSVLDPSTSRRSGLLIARVSNRIRRSTSTHLQAIVFAAFALEYRIRRIYEVLGLAHRKRDTLGKLLSNFRRRVETADRLDGKGRVRLPAEWPSIEARLRRVNTLRNDIAHANYQDVLKLLPADARKSRAVARDCFNALVKAIQVTNRAVGYEHRSVREVNRDYRRLKIR